MADIDDFDLDRSIAQAWAEFQSRLSEVISLIDDHLSGMLTVPRAGFGTPFYFNRSRILEVSTGIEVRTLREFRDAMSDVDSSAIYYHVFEAHLRLQRAENDFSAWIS